MSRPSDTFWFLDAEYDVIRNWVMHNEELREKHKNSVDTNAPLVKFETYYRQVSGGDQ